MNFHDFVMMVRNGIDHWVMAAGRETSLSAGNDRYVAADSRRPGYASIRGKQVASERLGQRNICRVVHGQVLPQLPYSCGQGVSRVASHPQASQNIESITVAKC